MMGIYALELAESPKFDGIWNPSEFSEPWSGSDQIGASPGRRRNVKPPLNQTLTSSNPIELEVMAK